MSSCDCEALRAEIVRLKSWEHFVITYKVTLTYQDLPDSHKRIIDLIAKGLVSEQEEKQKTQQAKENEG